MTYDAILLTGFGGPEGQDDVIPFLRNVTRGRGIPDERLEEVAQHYRAFGGVSPINEQNRQLKGAIEAELARRGIHLPVLWGNRNWQPYLADTLREANERGFRKLLAIATSAYSSYSSCRQYRENYASALAEAGLEGVLQIEKVRQFFDHPGFVQPFVDGLRQALADVAARGIAPADAHVLFSTHSIPSEDAARSGPPERDLGEGGAYVAQHRAVAEYIMNSGLGSAMNSGLSSAPGSSVAGSVGTGVAESLRDSPSSTARIETSPTPGPEWSLVYQSRSGNPAQPWLEPDINDAIAELAAGGTRAVVIVPLGFVSDHMEVKWDLDTEAMQTAEEHGVFAVRVPTPGVHPAFVSGLVDLVLERVNSTPADERPALTELGPWYDVCRSGCCENVRLGFKPALAGMAP